MGSPEVGSLYSSMLRVLSCILFLFVASALVGQEYFSKVYDPHIAITDIGLDIQLIDDDLYIIAGNRCINSTVDCASIIRIDVEGNLVWSRLFDFLDPGRNCVTRKSDTLIVAGHAYGGTGNDSTRLCCMNG